MAPMGDVVAAENNLFVVILGLFKRVCVFDTQLVGRERNIVTVLVHYTATAVDQVVLCKFPYRKQSGMLTMPKGEGLPFLKMLFMPCDQVCRLFRTQILAVDFVHNFYSLGGQ